MCNVSSSVFFFFLVLFIHLQTPKQWTRPGWPEHGPVSSPDASRTAAGNPSKFSKVKHFSDLITESRITPRLLLNAYITELDVIWLKFCFLGEKEERFCLRRTFPGGLQLSVTTHVSLHKHSRPSPNNSSMSKRETSKSWPKKHPMKRVIHPQNQNFWISTCSVICCRAKSVNIMSIGNADVGKDKFRSKAHVKNKKNTM